MPQAIAIKKTTRLKNKLTSYVEQNYLDINDFNKRCENALTIEQARAKTIEFIKKLPWKK